MQGIIKATTPTLASLPGTAHVPQASQQPLTNIPFPSTSGLARINLNAQLY